jgi:pimeloyl-ACP methyl ester carboxylesterase
MRLDLAAITAPTLVVYGTDDPLVRPSGPRALVRAIPGARLVEYPGVGHDVPRHVWADLVREMSGQIAVASPAD